MILKGTLSTSRFVIICLYAPNVFQSSFWEINYKELLEEPGSEILILDDFNAVLNKNLDRSVESSTPNIPAIFLRLMAELELVDVLGKHNEGNRDYTYFSYQHNISPQMGIRAVSDHTPMSAIWVEYSQIPRLHMWRLNNFLFESAGLVGFVEPQMDLFFPENDHTSKSGTVWDAF